MAEDRKRAKTRHIDLSKPENQEKEKPLNSSASRARNRTVMLTPDMAGQVRSLVGEDEGAEQTQASDWERAKGDPSSPRGVEPAGIKPEDDPLFNKEKRQGGKINTQIEQHSRGEDLLRKRRSPEPVLGQKFASEAEEDGAEDTSIATPVKKHFDPLTDLSSASALPVGARKERPRAPTEMPPEAAAVAQSRPVEAQQQSRPAPTPAPQAPQASQPAAATVSKADSKIIGFLISFDANPHGDVFEIRSGRRLVTSRPTDHGDYMLIDHRTISPLHAIIRASDNGKVQVLDQLSEFGTIVVKAGKKDEQDVTGAMTVLEHGDTIRFGERNFVFCLVPESATSKKDD